MSDMICLTTVQRLPPISPGIRFSLNARHVDWNREGAASFEIGAGARLTIRNRVKLVTGGQIRGLNMFLRSC